MVTVYFPDGTYRRVSAVEADTLLKGGAASMSPYPIEQKTLTKIVSIEPYGEKIAATAASNEVDEPDKIEVEEDFYGSSRSF